jgi:hypothetical protein
LQRYWETGLDVLEDALDCLRVLDQRIDRGGEQDFEALEWAVDRARIWLLTCFGNDRLDGVGVERQQA